MTEISPFLFLAAIMLTAGLAGLAAQALRQPLLVAYMVAGLGLSLFPFQGEIDSGHAPEVFAELGLTLLLFLVGLKLDTSLIRRLGWISVAAGILQISLTMAASWGVMLLLGVPQPFMLSFALALSSTIVTVKLLSDSRAIDSLYGKLALGILIVQDLAVVGALAVIGGAEKGLDFSNAGLLIVKLGVLAGLVLIGARVLAPYLLPRMMKAPELMVIGAIGWAAAMAAFADQIGLGKELGGLLAGMAMASSPMRHVMTARLSPIRDFLLVFFFVNLGMQLNASAALETLPHAIALSAFVLVFKPVLITGILSGLGYRTRTAFFTGISLSQISEFSLIFAATAAVTGLLDARAMALLTWIALITITLSTYLTTYEQRIFDFLERLSGKALPPQLRFSNQREETAVSTQEYKSQRSQPEIVVFGMGRYGTAMAGRLHADGWKILGVDFDPHVVRLARQEGFDVIYGDADDPDLMHALALDKVQCVVMAFPHAGSALMHRDTRVVLSRSLRQSGFQGEIAAPLHRGDDPEALGQQGISMLLHPFEDAAVRAAEVIEEKLS